MSASPRILLIACGALANELVRIKRASGWDALEIRCLPAELHNRPERIAPAVEKMLEGAIAEYDRVLLGYADCGTGGELDRLADRYGMERIPGAHCYEFFAGSECFEALAEAEPGTFYLTDYLARNFRRLIVEGMGLNRHPELKPMLFGNYRRLVYLAQQPTPELERMAADAAGYLELEYNRRDTGLGPLGDALRPLVEH